MTWFGWPWAREVAQSNRHAEKMARGFLWKGTFVLRLRSFGVFGDGGHFFGEKMAGVWGRSGIVRWWLWFGKKAKHLGGQKQGCFFQNHWHVPALQTIP
ncbi:MAG: hypothetical protein H6727_03435 [Myxococcales bacterium]|nr:hypothetical protein [Myxococcales bacterium]